MKKSFLFFRNLMFFSLIALNLNGQNKPLENKIKEMIVSDLLSIAALYGEKLEAVVVNNCIKYMIIDSSRISSYKIKVLFDCNPLFLIYEERILEYWIAPDLIDSDKLYRINGFFISDFFVFDSDFYIPDCFSLKDQKKIKKFLRKQKYEKITNFFYCNSLLYINKGKKNDRTFSRPFFLMHPADRHGI